MSEKTEQPTPKRLEEAKAKGQVVKSMEIVTGVQLAVILMFFYMNGRVLLQDCADLITLTIQIINQPIDYAMEQIGNAFYQAVLHLFGSMFIMLMLAIILSNLVQTGPMLALEAVQPKADKLNVINNIKNIFSLKSIFSLCINIIKVITLSWVFYYIVSHHIYSFEYLPGYGPEVGLLVMTRIIMWLWSSFLACYILFAVADYAFQYFTLMKEMMMTKEETKQEYKNMEGSPEVKQRQREQQREIASGSLASNVQKSTVVVRNPTHLAVCLYYHSELAPLPQVIEKAEDYMALHIIELAEKANVPVVENVPLARALYGKVELGEVIPESLFEPVAELLRMVMSLDSDDEDDDDDDDED
ncbi:MAG: EscU/YscU/HrcU family type III secretion system export apparatus switch protein [Enterobacteriaceae bacterium]